MTDSGSNNRWDRTAPSDTSSQFLVQTTISAGPHLKLKKKDEDLSKAPYDFQNTTSQAWTIGVANATSIGTRFDYMHPKGLDCFESVLHEKRIKRKKSEGMLSVKWKQLTNQPKRTLKIPLEQGIPYNPVTDTTLRARLGETMSISDQETMIGNHDEIILPLRTRTAMAFDLLSRLNDLCEISTTSVHKLDDSANKITKHRDEWMKKWLIMSKKMHRLETGGEGNPDDLVNLQCWREECFDTERDIRQFVESKHRSTGHSNAEHSR